MRNAIENGREATNDLDDAADFEEKTGRHELTLNLTAPHLPQPSSPQLDTAPNPSVLGILNIGVSRLGGWSLAAVLIVGIIVYGWLRSTGAVK